MDFIKKDKNLRNRGVFKKMCGLGRKDFVVRERELEII
jgi:hypothetical protein